MKEEIYVICMKNNEGEMNKWRNEEYAERQRRKILKK